MGADTFSQHPYRCRVDWGRRGTRETARRGDILVLVDTLSFSTAVATAVHHGAMVYPCAEADDPADFARRVGAELAVRRSDVPERGRFSLSPLTYLGVEPRTRIVLVSPNGATCSRYARHVPYLFVGALVNAGAIAAAVERVLAHTDLCVTVVACGERWRTPDEDGELRMAIEDYLAAGAILSALPYEKSPEAQVCEGSYLQTRGAVEELIWECGSGRELRAMGFGDDVRHAVQSNLYDSVPMMREEALMARSDL